MATLFDIIKQNKEGNLSSIPVYKDGGSLNWDKMNINQRRSYIFNFLKGKGLNEIQSASIVGNLEQENGKFDTKMTNSIGATGIAQWYKTRADALRSKGNYTHINTQLNYLLEELNGNKHWSTKAGGRDAFFKAKDLKTATQIFRKDFERPGEAEAHDNKRYKYALNVIGKNNEYTPYDNSPSSSEYIAEDSPYSKYDFSNQKLDYSQMNAQMESNQAFQKAMIEAMQSETNSKIALNQAQVYAIEQEQAEKISSQEAEKRKVEQDKIQSVLEEKNKQRDILMGIGLQTIPKYIERDETALRQLASSPMNFQFQGGFQQLIQGQKGGEFVTTNSNVDELEDIELAEVTNLNNKISPFNNIPIYKDVDSFRERNKHLTTNLPVYIDNKLQYEETPMFRENIGDAMFNVADYEIADSEGNLLKLPEQCTARACRVIDSMVGGNSYLEYSDDFKAKIGSTESSKSKPTEEDIAKNPYYYGDENYGSLDAWDIPYMTNKNSPKNVLYDAMRGERVMNQSDVQKNMISYNDLKEKVGEIPVGSFINLGIKNGKNTSEVLGGVHTVRVVGYDKQGEPLVADFDSVKELKKAMYIVGDKDIKSIMSVVSVPGKEKYNYSYFKNLENKSKKDSNENYIKSYSKMPIFNTDTGEIEYEKPSKEFKKYAKTLNKNKNYISALADISDEDYDRYAKIALTLPSVETKYGKDFLYSLGIDGESTGLSQLVQGNVKEKYPKILSKYPKKSAERDALSTVLYLKELDNYKETWFDDAESETERPYFLQNRSNIKDGVRKVQGRDRTGFYKNMLSGYTYNVDGNTLDIDSRNSEESEQDYTDRINSKIGDENLRFELVERGGEDKTPTIYKKTRGNLIKRDLEDSIGYLWQTPNSVRYGDALGDSKYYKKFKAVYENLFGKKMQKGGMFHKMYDERNKVNINSFKTRFIK